MAVEKIRCGGKVNLFLKAERLREDGFHDIATLFYQFTDPADMVTIDFDAAPGIKVSSSDPALPVDGDNLAGRAAARFAEKSRIAPHWDIFIEKNLPVAAGVGGGSANAGKVLVLLNRHYGVLTDDQMLEIAASLGSDVPLFLYDTAMIGRSRGEVLEKAPELPELPLLLVNPRFPITARYAYTHIPDENRCPDRENQLGKLIDALTQSDFPRAAQFMLNDLEIALFAKFPLLVIFRENLEAFGALKVIVSGSGSSLVALFPDREKLLSAQKKFTEKFPEAGCWVLGSHPEESK